LSLNPGDFEAFRDYIGLIVEEAGQVGTAGWFAQMHRAQQRTADAQTSPPARPPENLEARFFLQGAANLKNTGSESTIHRIGRDRNR